MPRRDDISSILLIGSGPIVIGQACEFDYSGTQACRVLRSEGYRVILANSNPATIMTDPDFADATYVEPLDLEVLTRIIERERPDALLPTLGGQTALNLAMELVEAGVLERHGVELIGADATAIGRVDRNNQVEIAGRALPNVAQAVQIIEARMRRVLNDRLHLLAERAQDLREAQQAADGIAVGRDMGDRQHARGCAQQLLCVSPRLRVGFDTVFAHVLTLVFTQASADISRAKRVEK